MAFTIERIFFFRASRARAFARKVTLSREREKKKRYKKAILYIVKKKNCRAIARKEKKKKRYKKSYSVYNSCLFILFLFPFGLSFFSVKALFSKYPVGKFSFIQTIFFVKISCWQVFKGTKTKAILVSETKNQIKISY